MFDRGDGNDELVRAHTKARTFPRSYLAIDLISLSGLNNVTAIISKFTLILYESVCV